MTVVPRDKVAIGGSGLSSLYVWRLTSNRRSEFERVAEEGLWATVVVVRVVVVGLVVERSGSDFLRSARLRDGA